MTLSEAIRLGAMLKPQVFGYFTDSHGEGSCAMKAASDAAGGHWREEWHQVTRMPSATCPECGYVFSRDAYVTHAGGAAIVHLNDVHRWTREQIADWVEQIEAQHAPQPEVGKQNLTEALR